MRAVGDLFDLRADQDSHEAIDERVRAGVRFGGTNLWVLFFAVLVASVGLNVNSTAVIIGAMLISPLMGPILGIGYGAAVNDTVLIGQAAKNLGVFTLLSLLASIAYFWLSPLAEPGTELLARTAPNLWDVLIAGFGGAAGMIGATRRGFTNVVPGVAIATALMPPLCTAGFGIAHLHWDFVTGSFYLFLINGVFIAAATLVVARILGLPQVSRVDAATARRTQWLISMGLLTVLVPSVWLGIRFVQREVFASKARAVVRDLQSEPDSGIVASSVVAWARRLELTVIGGPNAEREAVERAQALLSSLGARGFEVVTRRVGSVPDASELRRQIRDDLAQGVTRRLVELEALVHELSNRQALEADAAPSPAPPSPESVLAETQALEPTVQSLAFLSGSRTQAGGAAAEPASVVTVDVPRRLAATAHARLQDWLRQRVGQPGLELIEKVIDPPVGPERR